MKDDRVATPAPAPALPQSAARRPAAPLLLLLLILAGCALRLVRLGVPSIWYDEGVSLFLAGQSLPAMLAHTAGDIHPPLYYALLHLWTRLFGATEFAAGFFSLACGVLLIPLTYALGRRVAGRRAGLLAAFFVAFSPYGVWYSQELRMYTLGACLGLLAALGLWEALKGAGPAWRGWLVYALAAAAGLYTLYYFAFLLIALNIWALTVLRSRRWLGWAAAQAGALLLYAPWLPTFIRQATDPPVPPWRSPVPLGRLLAESWTALSFGHSVEAGQVWPLLLVTLALALLGLWRLLRKDGRDALLVAGYFVLPIGLIVAFSLVTPLYHVRYLFTYAPAAAILLGAGLGEVWARRRWLAALLALLWLIGAGFSLYRYFTAPQLADDDHRAAVQYVDAQWRPGDAVLLNAGYIYPPFVYYNRLPVTWRGRLSDYGTAFRRADAPAGLALLQTGAVDGPADLGWGSPQSDFYALSRQETAAALARLFADYERVWVYRCYDTVTDPDGFIRAWLDENAIQFEETPAFAGQSYLRVQGYMARRAGRALPATAQPAQITFGDGLELAGVEIADGAWTGGAPLDVVLWLRPTRAGLPRLALTLRLSDAAGHTWVQQDSQPLGSRYFSESWPAGELLRVPVRLALPAGLPPGEYQFQMGVYEAATVLPWQTPAGEQIVPLQTLPVAASAGS